MRPPSAEQPEAWACTSTHVSGSQLLDLIDSHAQCAWFENNNGLALPLTLRFDPDPASHWDFVHNHAILCPSTAPAADFLLVMFLSRRTASKFLFVSSGQGSLTSNPTSRLVISTACS